MTTKAASPQTIDLALGVTMQMHPRDLAATLAAAVASVTAMGREVAARKMHENDRRDMLEVVSHMRSLVRETALSAFLSGKLDGERYRAISEWSGSSGLQVVVNPPVVNVDARPDEPRYVVLRYNRDGSVNYTEKTDERP